MAVAEAWIYVVEQTPPLRILRATMASVEVLNGQSVMPFYVVLPILSGRWVGSHDQFTMLTCLSLATVGHAPKTQLESLGSSSRPAA